MALRLNEHVVRGAIRNSTRNSVTGWLEVLLPEDGGGESDAAQGEPRRRQLMVSLTGNLDGPLAGRDFLFEVQQPTAVDPLPGDPKSVQLNQIGAVGASSWRMARVPLIPADEVVAACIRGATPPVTRRPALSLEWFSQTGRVVL